MIDLAVPLQILGFVAFVAAPPIIIHRVLADPDWPGLSELFRIPVDPPWPRGVQEEEPIRWRVDHLSRTPADAERRDGRVVSLLVTRDRRIGA